MKLRYFFCLASAFHVAACTSTVSLPEARTDPVALAPAWAPQGSCWSKISSPAVVETVKEQVLVTPAKVNPDGTIASLPVYRSENRQQIVTARQDQWFETPCPPSLTVEFVSSLQRALLVRGIYGGPVNGSMDIPTRRAVRALQITAGLDSDVLSLQTARDLGLVAVQGAGTE